jgi:hypothetical protein
MWVESANNAIINKMGEAITNLSSQTTLLKAFDQLNNIDGIRLVIATKVYRFCHPDIGAALDRHVSYFVNSLEISQRTGYAASVGTNLINDT